MLTVEDYKFIPMTRLVGEYGEFLCLWIPPIMSFCFPGSTWRAYRWNWRRLTVRVLHCAKCRFL